ncbi:MAG: ferredoxin [Thermoprotei archaeon]|nr:MAG: ferredoxin [Thermoprotei archaeon]
MGSITMPKPVINKDACTGCGTCVSVCPQGVLELKDGKAEVVNPDNCTGCRTCEATCPSAAITVQD